MHAANQRDIQDMVWKGSLPLEIRLSPLDCRIYDKSMPYLVGTHLQINLLQRKELIEVLQTHTPRLSYLPFLLPRLHAFFSNVLIDSKVEAHQGWFSFERVPMKWQHPVGLLFDLFAGADPYDGRSSESLSVEHALPWKLTLHFSDWPSDHLIPLDKEGKYHHDNFINSVKEADFLRNGTAKVMMSLSKDDSTKLWSSVQQHNFAQFSTVNNKFLNPPNRDPLRHIPMKIYLPHTDDETDDVPSQASVRVVQGLMPAASSPNNPQTLGTALHGLLPTVFPSRRTYIHGSAVLHGAVVPPTANLLDLLHTSAYADGFLHIAISMKG